MRDAQPDMEDEIEERRVPQWPSTLQVESDRVEGGARCHVDYIAFVIDIREVAVGHEESDAQQN
jgi:hypothetical protein